MTHGPGDDMNPKWSPDGERIAFFSNRDGNEEIYVVEADGSDLRRLTSHSADDRNPAWSPDGRHIAFAAGPGKEHYDLYVIGANGKGRRQLTFGDGHDAHPSWSR